MMEFLQALKYLGVHVDLTLHYKQHLDEVKVKIIARVSLSHRRLSSSTWGASSQILPVPLQGAEVHMLQDSCRALTQGPLDNNDMSETHLCVPPARNHLCQSLVESGYLQPGKKSPEV